MPEKQGSTNKPSPKVAPSKREVAKWEATLYIIIKTLRVPLLCVLALVVGLWIGYVKVGGQSMSDMFHPQTWKHLFDLIFVD
jgi:hypothetical protein